MPNLSSWTFQAPTGLTLEVIEMDYNAVPHATQPAPIGFYELGNGHYTWWGRIHTDDSPPPIALIAREVGTTDVLASREITQLDALFVNSGTGSVDVNNVRGNIQGGVLGDPTLTTDDPEDPGNLFMGPGGLVATYDPAWSTILSGIGVDTAAIAAAVWDYLTSAATLAGSFGLFVRSKLSLITSGTRVVTQATVNQQELTFYRGSDYTLLDGAAPSWQAVFSPAELQSIAIKLHSTTLGTGVITSATGVQSGYVEVTAEDLDILGVGDHEWQLELTTVDGDVLPPAYHGKLHVKPGP